MWRQGDLLIIKVNEIPKDSVGRYSKVLAEGERTGHTHLLDGGEIYEKEGTLYFSVPEGVQAVLNHPEHKSISFKEGKYIVIRQREYLPKELRYVRD